jgi:hypothetical protein
MGDVTHLAYQLAVRNGIKNQFCKRNEITGRKWLKNYSYKLQLRRNQHHYCTAQTHENIKTESQT